MTIKETYSPSFIDGFKCYAPESASLGSDFPKERFEDLYRSEAGSFWFRGRQRIIEYLVTRFLQRRPAALLEIGCGTGFVLQGLSKYGGLELMGSELHLSGLKWAKTRVPKVDLIQLDATRLPFQDCFDAIGAFDVVEHIERDEEVFRQMFRAVKKGGWLFLTVPQHPWLWSPMDEKSMHKRRYTRSEMRSKLQRAGFKITLMSSFVTVMLPAMAWSRFRLGRRPARAPIDNSELQLPPLLDRLGEWSLRIEEIALRLGLRIPFGGSLVVVAQR